jgi:hypothetical protein
MMKYETPNFKHNFIEKNLLEQVTTDDGRYYIDEDGNKYDSVTTILSRLSKEGIDAWKKRVGEKEAKKISTQAILRGNQVHDICEKFLLNNKHYKMAKMPLDLKLFNSIKNQLVQNIDEIYGVEHSLYSKKLKAAGTADLICKWNGTNTIVDFKNSKYNKPEEWVQNYYIQASAYSQMVMERHDLHCPQFIVIIMCDFDSPQFLRRKVSDYQSQLHKIFIEDRNEFEDIRN